MKNSIGSYWYSAEKYPNLGDEITPILLDRMFGVKTIHQNWNEADLVSTGSILGWIRRTPELQRSKPTSQHVVGSGFMYAHENIENHELLTIHSVRGYLSKQKLDKLPIHTVGIGDPGLLFPEFAHPSSSLQHSRVGLIPHHSKTENDAFLNKFEKLNPTVLDIRTTNVDDFATQIASCDLIISHSLHGLVFADALGIPNVWHRLQERESLGDFKFYDYFSSVNRDFGRALVRIPSSVGELEKMCSVPDRTVIKNLQVSVTHSFERALETILSPTSQSTVG